ncbi:MAG: zf-HC2 domain-containing protein [Ilumatobacteraceae bacterium]
MSDDLSGMQCDQWIEAISARADGEEVGVDERLLDAHLAHCASCRSFAAAIDGSRRRLVVQEAPVMPDLSRRVAKSNAVLDRAGKWSIIRVLLIVVAAEIIVMAVPQLVLGDGEANAHDARHLGAFSIAYAVALLVAAVRPARARTVLPVAAMLAGALLVTGIVDLANGTVPLLNEASHIPEILSVVFVWLLAMPAPQRPATSVGGKSAGLRVVRDESDRKAV